MSVVLGEEERDTLEKMVKRVDRFMKAVQLEIRDGDFRVELVTDLMALRRKFDERSGDGERGSN